MGEFRSRITEVCNNRLPELTERLADAIAKDDRPRIKYYLDRVVFAHFDKLGYGGALELSMHGHRFDWAGFGARTDAPAEAVIVETKTCRGDLLADSKVQHYSAWCNRLWICAPAGEVQTSDLPGSAGLLEFSKPFEERENGSEEQDIAERVAARSGLRVIREAERTELEGDNHNEFTRALVRKLTYYPPLGTLRAEWEPEFV